MRLDISFWSFEHGIDLSDSFLGEVAPNAQARKQLQLSFCSIPSEAIALRNGIFVRLYDPPLTILDQKAYVRWAHFRPDAVIVIGWQLRERGFDRQRNSRAQFLYSSIEFAFDTLTPCNGPLPADQKQREIRPERDQSAACNCRRV
jgi:hypothetical protein